MTASVRTAGVPSAAPNDLAPFVVALSGGGAAERAIDDWQLTSDAAAVGDSAVATRYLDWCSTWQQQWGLDPIDSFRWLFNLVVEFGAGSEPAHHLAERLASDSFAAEGCTLSVDRAVLLPALIEQARSLCTENDALGVGLVDTTEAAATTGLLAGWPPVSATKTLASDHHACVTLHPTHRLCLELHNNDHTIEQLHDLTEVSFEGTRAMVSNAERTVEFDADEVRPLAWIAPGARSYRVRRVPAVVAVARTIARLPIAARVAVTTETALTLSCPEPVITRQWTSAFQRLQ
jgi:hypothetical protein